MATDPRYPPVGPYGAPPDAAGQIAHPPRESWRGRLTVLFAALACFLIACACPALEFTTNGANGDTWFGFRALVLGWLGVLFGEVAWCANPLMVLGLIFFLFRRWLVTIILSAGAVILSADTFLLLSQELPADEGGVNKMELRHIEVGFYFWVASMVVIMIGAIVLRSRKAASTVRGS